MSRLLLILVIGLLAAAPAVGQAHPMSAWSPQPLSERLRPPALDAAAPGLRPLAQSDSRGSHWVTGGVIGAVTLGLAGAVFAGGFCAAAEWQNSCTGPTIGGGLAGGGVGFILGALVGSLFPSGPRP